jgi:phosphoglycolate phosphatase
VALIPGTQIEIIQENIIRGEIRFALLDFDGTISLIREGWQSIMIPMMVDLLCATPDAEDKQTIENVVNEYVTYLTGKQTIYQMFQLVEEIKKRGGLPLDPLVYKQTYHCLLWERIKWRIAAIKDGSIDPDSFMIPGSRDLLEGLAHRGIKCFLASGTDENQVKEEASLLGIKKYFEGIYGAQDDFRRFSKLLVIQDIIQQQNLVGPELVSFGDGYVEIENTKSVGGIPVGVASNESKGWGINDWKRCRLIEAGAYIIIPNFSDHSTLLEFLFKV